MYRPAILLPLLFLCMHGHAECEVAVAGRDTISLVVGAGGCFSAPGQRDAFAAGLKQAVQAMERAPPAGVQRKSTAEQLNGFGDLKRQAKHLSPAPPVYYGQR